jgi:hypothetical protein
MNLRGRHHGKIEALVFGLSAQLPEGCFTHCSGRRPAIYPHQPPFLKETIDWVRNDVHAERRLPTVATATVFLPPNPSAQLTVYTRKKPHPRLPHIVWEFRLGCYIYAFAVPFSQQDGWNLIGFFDDADFNGTFKHYIATAQ